jgi:hypothetical protein
LQRRGVSLDIQRSLMQPQSPLWEAWLAFLTQHAMGEPTFVLQDLHHGEAFIQVRYRPHQAAADVVFMAPTLSDSPKITSVWSDLIEGSVIEAAGQGIQRVFANLPASGAELDVFQQAGFTLYGREDVYRLQANPGEGVEGPSPTWRPQKPEDWPAIQKLCVAVTPQRVRQAEGGIGLTTRQEKNCQRYVLSAEPGEELVAALTLCLGQQAYWLRLLVHPDSRHLAEQLIGGALAVLANHPPKPIYCNVRQYENDICLALEAEGFRLFATRSLMVKHTVAWIKTPVPEAVPALKSSAEAIPPAYRLEATPEPSGREGRLATETNTE